MAIFQTFFLRKIGQENVFYDILERELAILSYKNIKLKKKNEKLTFFLKGLTHGFCP